MKQKAGNIHVQIHLARELVSLNFLGICPQQEEDFILSVRKFRS